MEWGFVSEVGSKPRITCPTVRHGARSNTGVADIGAVTSPRWNRERPRLNALLKFKGSLNYGAIA
jgi:hypothetical protein